MQSCARDWVAGLQGRLGGSRALGALALTQSAQQRAQHASAPAALQPCNVAHPAHLPAFGSCGSCSSALGASASSSSDSSNEPCHLLASVRCVRTPACAPEHASSSACACCVTDTSVARVEPAVCRHPASPPTVLQRRLARLARRQDLVGRRRRRAHGPRRHAALGRVLALVAVVHARLDAHQAEQRRPGGGRRRGLLLARHGREARLHRVDHVQVHRAHLRPHELGPLVLRLLGHLLGLRQVGRGGHCRG